MAGYIGSKTVNLSTTGADIAGDADVSGDLDVGGAFTLQGIDDNATSTAMTLDASGKVGIGTTSPSATLDVASGNASIHLTDTDDTTYGQIRNNGGTFTIASDEGQSASNSSINFRVDASEAMRLDSSGNLLVGTTDNNAANNSANSSADNGIVAKSDGQLQVAQYQATAGSGAIAWFNRTGTDGSIVNFNKSGSTVGSIGVTNAIGVRNTYISGTLTGLTFANAAIIPTNQSGAVADNSKDLGYGLGRFDDIFATNGTINTSDRNEKQDIAELSDAEQRVAVAAKGLMRKFRWRDAVEAKGDEARTHFGIIAQDLQAAFAAEGLNASRYAMFCSDTWWEHDVEVPAVEAVAEVLDEDGNVVTEAVEAADAYTRTDTYDTQEEAPEGATERTRLGVRYSELLAFIIGAL